MAEVRGVEVADVRGLTRGLADGVVLPPRPPPRPAADVPRTLRPPAAVAADRGAGGRPLPLPARGGLVDDAALPAVEDDEDGDGVLTAV